jgi:hypothetical protein
MTAATAETLSTQLAQIEDAASEFAEAVRIIFGAIACGE